MARPVRVRNLSSGDIEVGGHTIPANGSLVMPYTDYIDMVTENDLSGFRLKVPLVNVERNDVSVSDFGARGDGITDDFMAVQRAVDYVTGYGGGVVRFPAGVYLADGLDAGNVTLYADSGEAVIKAPEAGLTIGGHVFKGNYTFSQ